MTTFIKVEDRVWQVEGANHRIVLSPSHPDTAESALAVWEEAQAPSFPDPVPESISRRQLILALASMELITPEEALAAARAGEVPAAVQTVFDNLPPTDKLAAEVTWATMSIAERGHPLVALLAAANEMSDGDVDDFFRLAAGL